MKKISETTRQYAENCYKFAVSVMEVCRYEDALLELNKAIRMVPGNAKYRYQAGIALQESGKPRNAIMQIKKAVKLEPNNVLYRRELSRLLRLAGHYKAARKQREIADTLHSQRL